MGIGAPPLLRTNVPVFSRLYDPKDRVPNVPVRDSAVEIEIDTGPVIGVLTTPDGTVGSFLGERPVPQWLEKSAKDPRQLLWDKLNPRDKLRLLQHGAKLKKTSFNEDRSIKGIRVKPVVTLRFGKETDFLGKTYPAGSHDVDVSNVFGKVEYRGPKEVLTVGGLELHFREGDATAGTVSRDAWTFLDGLGAPRTHQHVHVVAPMPFGALQRDPVMHPLRMTDFVRRANAVAEMIGILWHGQSITEIKEKESEKSNIIYFKFLKADDLGSIFSYLRDIAHGLRTQISRNIAWVSFRGLNKYDDPELWGMENRWLNADAPSEIAREFLDTVQTAMLNDEYGIPDERPKQWSEWLVKKNIKYYRDGFAKAWFHKDDWESVLQQAPDHIRKFWERTDGPFTRLWARLQGKPTFHEKLALFRETDASLDLLFHDWSFDPLLFDDPKKLARIADEQLRALNRILAGEDLRPAVQDFLKDSELFTLFAASLGGKKHRARGLKPNRHRREFKKNLLPAERTRVIENRQTPVDKRS